MGTIITRKKQDGTASYTAQVVLKRGGVMLAREHKTFADRREATLWMAQREVELHQPGAVAENPKLADVIDRYIREARTPLGDTKSQVLRAIKSKPIGAMRCRDIASKHVIALANNLAESVQPQTVQNYLSHLSAVFAIARPAWGYPLDRQAMQDAFAVAKRLGLTTKSRKRSRRPMLDELDRLLDHFTASRSRRCDSVPMVDVVLFALFSTRRLEEIARIRWADFEPDHGRVLVRDMKHPGEKIGNDQWVDLPPEAMAVIARQPRHDARIFPYSGETIGAAFTRATRLLGIEDLHFHDLRHDGVSRLFELGWSIPHVAAVSGHRSWQSLKRYTHLRQRGDKYAGWRWLKK